MSEAEDSYRRRGARGAGSMKFGGVEIGSGMRFDELAVAALLGRVGDSRSTTDTGPLGWLYRVWPELERTPHALILGSAIGDAVHHTNNPEVQYNGLVFLSQHPQPSALQHLLHMAAAPQSLMAAPPSAGDYTMRFWLIRAIASLAESQQSVDAVLVVLESEALSASGTVLPALHTLIHRDASWWAEHRDDVIRLHPEAEEVIRTIESA